jgi:hypothetical protein
MEKVSITSPHIRIGQDLAKHGVLAIPTVSAKKLIERFGEDIMQMDGRASIEGAPLDDNLVNIGAKFVSRKKISFFWNYDDKKHVSLTPTWLKELYKTLEGCRMFDVAVNRLVLRVTDEDLIRIVRELGYTSIDSKETTWIAEFEAEPYEDEELDKRKLVGEVDEDGYVSGTELQKYNYDLIKQHKFQYTLLNLKRLLPYSQYISLKKEWDRTFVVDWSNMISPKEIALELQHTIGADYAIIKGYVLTSDDKLVLTSVN